MLKSMTGFGAAVAENDAYKVTVELKAVNQRFFEVNFHMPRQLGQWEERLRKMIRQTAARGKVDIFINFQDKRETKSSIRVDKGLALAYQAALNELSDTLHIPRPDDAALFAGFPEVLQVEQTAELDDMLPVLLEAVDQAAMTFDSMRQREGAHIAEDFLKRLALLEDMRQQLIELSPVIVEERRQHLQAVLAEAFSGKEMDETRIIQETALFADRVNYTEEIVRLASHISQFRQIMEAEEPVGRKLDFLIQEFNRETNTIGSKANNKEAAQLVVDMKSEIEKIREQVQNIE
ncbi:TIGR00255 family protein [Selenomonas ruminantium]|uniref:TIGR00255 family protein n=1 Tax=Selenomonas ruminantium TaxID=971 RepID=A0A1M6V7W7_SELRU|nr:YicC/YloC family endoribonuclease [Selenomonas ruminantium]SHK77474.1 TIGR00255 family protein [Selenomonas ruminantium]